MSKKIKQPDATNWREVLVRGTTVRCISTGKYGGAAPGTVTTVTHGAGEDANVPCDAVRLTGGCYNHWADLEVVAPGKVGEIPMVLKNHVEWNGTRIKSTVTLDEATNTFNKLRAIALRLGKLGIKANAKLVSES